MIELERLNILFLKETLQGNRIRPATFIHEIKMPFVIFREMKEKNLIDLRFLTDRRPSELNRKQNPIAFFEFKDDTVTISFQHIYNREDFRTVVDRFLIIKAYGEYPLKANWVSKMNFDKKVEYIVYQRNNKKLKKYGTK